MGLHSVIAGRYWRMSGLIIGAWFLYACASTIYEPKAGVTREFYPPRDNEVFDFSRYDWSKLERGYGLHVFSYVFRTETGNKIVGFKNSERRGVRVWEYKFRDQDWDVKEKREKTLFWGYRSFLTLFLAREGLAVKTAHTYHNGRVVYGGRLIVDASDPARPAEIQMHADEDLGPWMTGSTSIPSGVKLDTALMYLW